MVCASAKWALFLISRATALWDESARGNAVAKAGAKQNINSFVSIQGGIEMDLTNSLLAGCCVASCIAAIFAFMAYLGGRRTDDDLTVAKSTHLVRAETEIIRGSMDNHSRGLRQELVHLLGTFQDAVFAGFGGLRTGIETQVTEFGGRLDNGILLIDQKTNGISNKLNTDMERMRSEAVTNRDNLRTLVENKLDQNLAGHTETAKVLKDELSDNFHRLGARVNDSLGESSKAQNDRLESATVAITSLSEKMEKAQEGLRVPPSKPSPLAPPSIQKQQANDPRERDR